MSRATSTAGSHPPAPTGQGSGFELRGVSKSYSPQRGSSVLALDAIDLRIAQNEFVCVVGPSGCGKTTLLKMLAGFESPTTGVISSGGTPITGPGVDRGVVFQEANLYPWLTVRQNVELGPKLRGASRADRRRIAEQHLELVELAHAADQKPYELSGGMQQRVQIARVLANRPEIMLMDEPFGALDALTRETLQDELLRIWQEQRSTVFFITHSVEEAVFLGTRVIVMSARPGRIVLDLPIRIQADTGLSPAELRSSPEFVALRDRITAEIIGAAR